MTITIRPSILPLSIHFALFLTGDFRLFKCKNKIYFFLLDYHQKFRRLSVVATTKPCKGISIKFKFEQSLKLKYFEFKLRLQPIYGLITLSLFCDKENKQTIEEIEFKMQRFEETKQIEFLNIISMQRMKCEVRKRRYGYRKYYRRSDESERHSPITLIATIPEYLL